MGFTIYFFFSLKLLLKFSKLNNILELKKGVVEYEYIYR